MQAQGAGNWPAPIVNYIEDMFSTYLYAGNGSTQTIINGIDLSGQGGLVWIKSRTNTFQHNLIDTVRGPTNRLSSNTTDASSNDGGAPSFNSNGFTVVANSSGYTNSGQNFVSWTFRKQPKFFDVVTGTTDGSGGITINHNLGSAPGCVIMKATGTTSEWSVYHRSLPSQYELVLNTTAAQTNLGVSWTSTSTTFTAGAGMFASSTAYVFYLFAHNAGGFGLTGNDNVITCGSFTTDGSGNIPAVTLGYEPQWILFKNASSAQGWWLFDTMRGLSLTAQAGIQPNTSGAEQLYSSSYVYPTATGFAGSGSFFGNSVTVTYIAIRRGPMKVPTVGTSVYATDTLGSTSPTPPGFKSGFPVDWSLSKDVTAVNNWFDATRLLSQTYLSNNIADPENAIAVYTFDYQSGWFNTTTVSNRRGWMFQRAPGFFDVVCYTGTGVQHNETHNLSAVPELIISKSRSATQDWGVYSKTYGASQEAYINYTFGFGAGNAWGGVAPTSTTFSVGASSTISNVNNQTYVVYLFATCPGVSKVGSYTGTGATQTIDCGFTSGARFVLIKRTDSTGDWYVWDTARGMVSGTDPSLLLNTTAAEVNANSVYTTGVGFQIVSTAAGINASGGTYIFLAVA
jgi:hypothetical protein